MVKLISVVMIIAGAIFMLVSAVMMIGVGALGAVGAAASGEVPMAVDLAGSAVLSVISLLSSACQIAAGIKGLSAARTGRALTCLRLGAALMALIILSNAVAYRLRGEFSFSALVASLFLPSLYIISANSLYRSPYKKERTGRA